MPCKWFPLLLSALCWTKCSPPSFTLPSQLDFPTSLVVFDHSEEISVSYPLFFTGRGWQLWEWASVQKLGCSTRALARRLSLSSACAEHMHLSHSLKFLLWGRSSVKRMLLMYHDVYSCRGIQAFWTTSYNIALLGLLLLSEGLSLLWVSAVSVHGERRVCTCSSQSCSTLGGSWTFAQLGRDRSFPPAPLFIYFSVGRWQCWWFLLSWIYVKSLFAAAQRSQHVAWAQADQVPWLNQFLREGVS